MFSRDGLVAFDDQRADLIFYIDTQSGEVVVLEPVGRTWSQIVYGMANAP